LPRPHGGAEGYSRISKDPDRNETLRLAARPDMEKQIAEVMNTWVKERNEKRIDDLLSSTTGTPICYPRTGVQFVHDVVELCSLLV
jgi:hypothetical protein